LGGLILLTVFALSVTTKSWREAKRSPYYFLRVQAAKKMQTYMMASIMLIVLIAIGSIFAWQTPENIVPQLAILHNAKPTPAITDGEIAQAEIVVGASPETVTISLAPEDVTVLETDVDNVESLIPETESTTATEPVLEDSATASAANLGPIAFSTDITSDYQAIDPGQLFNEGFFTLYATFYYEGMDGADSWSWQWKHNGQVIEGGEQQWAYGANGPGYVYFQPEQGFQLGEHSLELWVGDQLMSQSDFSISEGFSASN
jgi:hypothetical protein